MLPEETIEYKGYSIEIGRDDNADDPNHNWWSGIYKDNELAFDDALGLELSSREEAISMAKAAIDKYAE